MCCVSCYVLWFLFFFQAEDGIRDLVRSRGLGDVYKRQVHTLSQRATDAFENAREAVKRFVGASPAHELVFTSGTTEAVSYTHLTLPTSDLV